MARIGLRLGMMMKSHFLKRCSLSERLKIENVGLYQSKKNCIKLLLRNFKKMTSFVTLYCQVTSEFYDYYRLGGFTIRGISKDEKISQ